MKTWWDKLASREQKILLFGSIALVLFLIYSLAWHPFTTKIDTLKQQIVKQEALLKWMQAKEKEMTLLKASATAQGDLGGQSLLSVVDQSVKEETLRIYPAELFQIDSEQVRVKFSVVYYAELLVWIDDLWNEFGIQTMRVNVTAGEGDGLVQAEVVLKAM